MRKRNLHCCFMYVYVRSPIDNYDNNDVVVNIHFVSFSVSFFFCSMTVLQYLISMYSDRQLMVTRRRERERRGGTETKFYQSSTSSRVNAFITNCQRYNTMLIFLAFSLSLFVCKCIYLPAKTSYIIRFVTNDGDIHLLFFFVFFFLARFADISVMDENDAREREKKRRINMRIESMGLVRVELQISAGLSIFSNRIVDSYECCLRVSINKIVIHFQEIDRIGISCQLTIHAICTI